MKNAAHWLVVSFLLKKGSYYRCPQFGLQEEFFDDDDDEGEDLKKMTFRIYV